MHYKNALGIVSPWGRRLAKQGSVTRVQNKENAPAKIKDLFHCWTGEHPYDALYSISTPKNFFQKTS